MKAEDMMKKDESIKKICLAVLFTLVPAWALLPKMDRILG